ncbi:MAG: cation-translocating P-type ATPase [Actinobacteria bacterium]|nr:MAG: cation-translocating P-type ATPase [Actinomycetota bacterium]
MLHEFDIGAFYGLTEHEAKERLAAEGYNELPASKPRNVFAIAVGVVREPMLLLLIAGGIIYLLIGDVREALFLLAFVFVVVGITFYQERKTERALEALRDMSSPRALVIRDGEQRRIAGREVVREDMLVLAEGDRVPADAVLLAESNLSVDESLLTGESVPVRKEPWDGEAEMGPPGGDDLPFLYSGTLVVQGQGVVRVIQTGAETQIGKIGKALQTLESERTRLQRETSVLVRNLATLGLATAVAIVLLYGLGRAQWLNGFLAGITFAMAMLPEEFPVVLTVFLALGAWRISRDNVLTRRVPAVETLGSSTVLCVDKTGTITRNEMSVNELYSRGEYFRVEGPPPDQFHELVEFSILASHRDPFDPMEKAFRNLGQRYLANTEHLHEDWSLVREYPLSKQLLALSHVWKSPDGTEYVIAAKGAPEAVGELCHLPAEGTAELSRAIEAMAGRGLRVLGVAKAYFEERGLPGEQHDFDFEFLGLVGLEDPVRSTVPSSIAEAQGAGIRVIMITGDYPATARMVARAIGLENPDEQITGPELDEMDDAHLRRRLLTANVFARVVPEQKLRIVQGLKANGEVVAMTGDGVNDAPALKASDIGIAMGGRGTDVAREASALVLLDDDFSSIVKAVRSGRRIFDNLQKAIAYILAIHVPIAGMSLIPVIFGLPLVLQPVHIVFLELIIDPASSIAFEAEPEEPDVMSRPPRDPHLPLFSRRSVGLSLLQGASVLAILLVVFGSAVYRGQGEGSSRALAFTTLIVANLGLILVNRSWTRVVLATLKTPNKALWAVIGSALAFLGLVLYLPPLRSLFLFAPLSAADLAVALSAGIFSILWFEGLKLLNGRRKGGDVP